MTELYPVTQLVMEILPLILIALLIGSVMVLAYEIYQQKKYPKVIKTVTASKPIVPSKPVLPQKPIAVTQQFSVTIPPQTQLPLQIPPLQPLAVPPVTTNPPLTPWPKAVSHNKRTRELFGQLVKLMQGDSDAANRLVAHQRSKNSAKSEEWILEKTIDDLTRDRS
ncbi:hypothetical protein [Scytonema sp. NUACC26]|uniref:hypothetical protein n=1 Tax=Scytonema sp. NUACC26 TaxID=3140176 RepID=UPI0034DBFD9C